MFNHLKKYPKRFNRRKNVLNEETTEIPKKKPDENAIEVIDVSDKCFVEIFENNNVYSYTIKVLLYDYYDYGKYQNATYYYWSPIRTHNSFFDSKNNAITSAFEELKNRSYI